MLKVRDTIIAGREDASIWQLLWLLLKSSKKGLKRQESKRQPYLKEGHKVSVGQGMVDQKARVWTA